MSPNFYQRLKKHSNMVTVFGNADGGLRVYPHGKASSASEICRNTDRAFAVWQVVGGSPLNSLNCAPTSDRYTIQIDVYSETEGACASAADTLRDAFSSFALIVSFRGTGVDKESKFYRTSFDVSLIQKR